MTVVELPTHGRWAWDARGDGRALRVSTHAAVGLLNVSMWRGDLCVGAVRLQPDEVATLVAGLTDGLAALAAAPPASAGDAGRLRELEDRLTHLEERRRTGAWRRVVSAARGRALRAAARAAVPPAG
jgi:hypothetical protein